MTNKETLAFFANLYRVPEKRLPTFHSYMKLLTKQGIPEGVNVGRGSRFDYDEEALWQMALVCELINCGLTIQAAVDAAKPHLATGDFRLSDTLEVRLHKLGIGRRESLIQIDVAGLRSAIEQVIAYRPSPASNSISTP